MGRGKNRFFRSSGKHGKTADSPHPAENIPHALITRNPVPVVTGRFFRIFRKPFYCGFFFLKTIKISRYEQRWARETSGHGRVIVDCSGQGRTAQASQNQVLSVRHSSPRPLRIKPAVALFHDKLRGRPGRAVLTLVW